MNDSISTRVQEILTTNGLDFRIEKIPFVGVRQIMAVNNSGDIVNDVEHVKSDYFGLLNSKSGNIINTVKEGYENEHTNVLKRAIKILNDQLKLNVDLGIDVQYGKNYAEVH